MDENKVAIVTGGAGGIGMATALNLGRAGYSIAIVELTLKHAQNAVEALKVKGVVARAFACDVADPDLTDIAFQDIFTWHNRVDILVNNAGISQQQNSLKITPQDWRKIVGVNLNGAFHCIRSVTPIMGRSKRGAIVNVASISGLVSVPGRAAYNAAKHGVIGLTRSFGTDLAHLGIRVNAVAPGMVESPMTQAYLASPDFSAALKDSVAMGRAGQPEEIANAIAFLASDKASYITAAILVVDGGFTAEKTFAPSSITSFSPAE